MEEIRAYRIALRSRSATAAEAEEYPRISVDFELTKPHDLLRPVSRVIDWEFLSPNEEIAYGPALWLWDYLRRSGQGISYSCYFSANSSNFL